MQKIYCSKCHTSLTLVQKAMPEFGRVITLADPHKCLEEPLEFDLTPVKVPKPINPVDDSDNGLVPNDSLGILGAVGTGDLKDRRAPEHIKSTAPESIIEQIRSSLPSTPANDVSMEPEEE